MIVIVRMQLPDGEGREAIAKLLTEVAEDIKGGPYNRAAWEVEAATLSYSILGDADTEAWLPFAEPKPKK